jgi:hypothetical protein
LARTLHPTGTFDLEATRMNTLRARNDLRHRCPGLERNDPLMYRSSVGQLCGIDVLLGGGD